MNTLEKIRKEVSKVIVGQENLINGLLIGLITNGHILVEGVPGLAKTTAVNALATALGLKFKRIQFTPDLLPSDITGTEIYNQKKQEFEIKRGPIFSNLVLADEINRAPSKVQASLLEAMQEKQITIGEDTFKLEAPFLVMATENPVENEGTYPLPEAQLDRFMLKIVVDYNTIEEEIEIMDRVAHKGFEQITQVVSKEEILSLTEQYKKIHVDEAIKKYIADIIFATRYPKKYSNKLFLEIGEFINFGASPRATIDLYKASCAFAILNNRDYVTPLDVKSVADNILQHRLVLNYFAEAKNITSSDIINKILDVIPVP